VNSPYDELNPIFSPDGSTLYFTRRKHPANKGGNRDDGDIWYCEQDANGEWSEAKNLGAPINNIFANELIGFADNGNLMYLHHHYQENGSKARTQGISVSRKSSSGQWSLPEPVKIPYFYNKSTHQSGCLHASGNILVLSLQSYDSRGAEDLYVLFKQSNEEWSEPINLGNTVNTPYQEMTPFLAPDGETLFFASNGHEGMGSRDIFVSRRLDGSWKNWAKPENLGSTVNTEGVELYYSIPGAGKYAYLSSTQNSDGMGDLNRVPIQPGQDEILEETASPVVEVTEEPVVVAEEAPIAEVMVQGTITNVKNADPVGAKVTFVPIQADSLQETPTFEATADEEGQYEILLPTNENYDLRISADGYMANRDVLLLRQMGTASVNRDFGLTPLEVGATVQLQNVLFERGTTHMIGNSTEELQEVVRLMQENPNMEIELSGHTDNTGRPDLNLLLSQDRADAVKKYLVEQDIATERVIAKGYGGTRPIASNAVEEERRKNRRVEFTIIKK
jgi:outer membrane protein OmpA-like peptidoglycan-associated protein